MKRHYLLLLHLLLFMGCNFSRVTSDLENGKNGIEKEILTAKRAISFIQTNKIDSLKQMVDPESLAKTKEEDLNKIHSSFKELLTHYHFPADSQIIVTNSIIFRPGAKLKMTKLSFPFTHKIKSDSIKYISIAVSGDLVYTLVIHDYPFGLHIVEPKHTEPHLLAHTLDYQSINWFRIWYNSGFKQNEYGDSYGYYAVSGDKTKLEKAGVQDLVVEIFTLINNATIDSTDFKHIDDDPAGEGEYIHLRFKFNNPPYDKFGECTIRSILEDEAGKKSIFADYVIFKHSEKTRYLYSKAKNPQLVTKLIELAYRDYGRLQEFRTH